MDMSLTSFGDAFSSDEFQAKAREFPVVAFVLAAEADENVFPKMFKEMLTFLHDMHRMTAREILIVGPKVEPARYRGRRPLSPDEITALWYDGRAVPEEAEPIWLSYQKRYLKRQTEETYAFAEALGINLRDLPGVAFFSTLEDPKDYLYWKLEGQQRSDVVRQLRGIVDAVRKARKDGADPLRRIQQLNRRRFVLKALRGVGRVAPTLIGIAAKVPRGGA